MLNMLVWYFNYISNHIELHICVKMFLRLRVSNSGVTEETAIDWSNIANGWPRSVSICYLNVQIT